MLTQQSMFSEEETQCGRPARWADADRKEWRFKRLRAGVQAELLCCGWRLKIRDGVWIARHPKHGVVRAATARRILAAVRAFTPKVSTQLALFEGGNP